MQNMSSSAFGYNTEDEAILGLNSWGNWAAIKHFSSYGGCESQDSISSYIKPLKQ